MCDEEREGRRRDKFYSERRLAPQPPTPSRERSNYPPATPTWRARLPPPVGVYGPPAGHLPQPPHHHHNFHRQHHNTPPPPFPPRNQARSYDHYRTNPPPLPPPHHPRSPPHHYRPPPPLPQFSPPPRKRPALPILDEVETGPAKRRLSPPLFRSPSPSVQQKPHIGRPTANPDKKTTNANTNDPDGFKPVMMSFKAFLDTQDDFITDEEALAKYAEYKLEFKRQQLNEFFVLHRSEEWFKMNYHPVLSKKKEEDSSEFVRARLAAFLQLQEKGVFSQMVLEESCEGKLMEILDTFVILLEGGGDQDIAAYFNIPWEQTATENTSTEDSVTESSLTEVSVTTEASTESGPIEIVATSESATEATSIEVGSTEDGAVKSAIAVQTANGTPSDTFVIATDNSTHNDNTVTDTTADNSTNVAPTVLCTDSSDFAVVASRTEKQNLKSPKTSSIFLKTLPPTTTLAELTEICAKFPGFLRVFVADPTPDKKWSRRGWVTFERDAKVREICFHLNNVKLRDWELGPVVNKDLSKRIRAVMSPVYWDRKVVRNDIKLIVQLIQQLDSRWGLWKPDSASGPVTTIINNCSNNPLLVDIHDYLVEEVSAEEEELLGQSYSPAGHVEEDGDPEVSTVPVVYEERLVRKLDLLIVYLRLVHSVDYYSRAEYTGEDQMPNRCGIMHVRSTRKEKEVRIEAKEVEKVNSESEKRLKALGSSRQQLTEAEAAGLGIKTEEDETEKFMMANCQELAKDKWLCPLSGKKFKGPEFLRKHIFNKFPHLIEEVKQDTQYFNNYLRDPKRPEMREDTSKTKQQSRDVKGMECVKGRRQGDLLDRKLGNVRERLAAGGGPTGVKVTHARHDPRDIVDYSDVELMGSADLFS